MMWGQAKELQLDTLVHYFTYSYDFGRLSLLCLKDKWKNELKLEEKAFDIYFLEQRLDMCNSTAN